MKRLFITTNVEKVTIMYSRTNYEYEKKQVESDFSQLPKVYQYGEDFEVIVLKDNFNDWGNYNIVKENDCILYHKNSESNVVKCIKNHFNLYKEGSHELNETHDNVYQIIFYDKFQLADKADEILKALGFTEEQKTEKNEHEVKLDFLHHCLTTSGLIKDEVTSSEWAKLDEYKNLATKANDGPFGANYISALRTLRDKLLVA